MIDLLEAYQPWSNPGRPPRVPLPARAKKAGRQKLTRVDQCRLDDPRGRPSAGWMTRADDPGRPSTCRPTRVGRPDLYPERFFSWSNFSVFKGLFRLFNGNH